MNKIAIHGFGRIGRVALRAALQRELMVPAVVTDIQNPEVLAALFEVDSNFGRWGESVSFADSTLRIGDRSIRFVDAGCGVPDWAALGVQVVVDCTARAVRREVAEEHLRAGASRVLVSAPSKSRQDCDAVILPGINLDRYDPEHHRVISMASCTTNALAPVVKVLKDLVGLEGGFFVSVHAYTTNNQLVDGVSRKRRDSWAAARNTIPAASGAAVALKYIWPDLAVTGKSYRVPVATGSVVELNASVSQATSVSELAEAFCGAAASGPLCGVLDVLEEEWPSSRIVGESHSSIVDLPLIQVIGDRLVSVAAWYDNEMGYAHRLIETACALAA